MKNNPFCRRKFLKALGGAAALGVVPSFAHAKMSETLRELSLTNIHTGESHDCTYWLGGSYVDGEVCTLDHLLRDFRANESIEMDRRLYDAIFTLKHQFEYKKPVQIISGYRSPKTNDKLRAMGRKVAKNSYHTRGMAVDIAMPGVNLNELRKAAEALKLGGVGYYPRDGFIHIDTGRVRRWG